MMAHVIAARDLRDPRLDGKAKAVLMNLASRANEHGECYPAVSTIGADTALSPKSVQRALADLASFGLIAFASGKAAGRTSRYVLFLDVRRTLGQTVPPPLGRTDRPLGHTVPPPLGHAVPPLGHTDPAPSVTESHIRESQNQERQPEDKSVSLSVSPKVGHTDLPTDKWPSKVEACAICFKLGASPDEAQHFYRYNQLRRWRELAHLSLADLARAWIDNLLKRDPDHLANEHARRTEERRACEEAALRARIAAEEGAVR